MATQTSAAWVTGFSPPLVASISFKENFYSAFACAFVFSVMALAVLKTGH